MIMIGMNDVADPKIIWVAAAELAVGGEIKQCECTNALVELTVYANGPDDFQLQRRLPTDALAFVPEIVGF